MTFQGRCDSSLVIKYLESLIKKQGGRKIIIIMDNARYHTSAAVREFCLERAHEIEEAEWKELWKNLKGGKNDGMRGWWD
jgi:transposase